MFRRIAIALAALALLNPTARAESPTDWPQFRGPAGNGVSATEHPAAWGKEQLAWSTDIEGGGWSSPIIAGDRVFLTTAISKEYGRPKGFGQGVASMGFFYMSRPPQKPMRFEVQCLQLSDGKLLWKKEVASRKPEFKIHPSNSYATESPATDGKFVYAYFAAIGAVVCLDLDGREVWTRELGAYPTSNNFGTGSSLAIYDGHVFVQCDNDKSSFVVALNGKTGEDAWRVERTGRTSWSSPLVWQNQARVELVTCGAGEVTSFDPKSGKLLWRLKGTGGAFSASPTCDAQRIYFGNSGRNSRGPLIAVDAGASGELTMESVGQGVAWVEKTSAPGMCSPVVYKDRLYVLSRSILSCHDAETGKRLYRERLKDAGSVTASLWTSGDKLFVLNESGQTSVIQTGDDFKLLASNSVPGLYWSTPSVAGKALLLRGAQKLHCVR